MLRYVIVIVLLLLLLCGVWWQARDKEEEATPRLFDFNANRSSGRAVVNRDEFFQQFNVSHDVMMTS